MSLLPVLDSQRRKATERRSIFATALRCGLVLLIAVAIRLLALDERPIEAEQNPDFDVNLSLMAEFMPTAVSVGKLTADGLRPLNDATSNTVGLAISTMPKAATVVGYKGPSNVLLLLDESSKVVCASLLQSEDTPEHVAAVLADANFLNQFHGWMLGAPNTFSEVDSVSGATLTSLAIAEGIAVRLGSEKPSLRFPDQLCADDVELLFGKDSGVKLRAISSVEAEIRDEQDQPLGTLIRTGPLVDSLAGYQGPSEVLLQLGPDKQTVKLALRNTYDNQPYAGYLNEEPYFWKVFREKSIQQISNIDLEEERVEGVSGATMTSMAVAETIIAAARQYAENQQQQQAVVEQNRVHWSHHDTGTMFVLFGGIVIGLTRLRGVRWLQKVWNIVLVAYFGLMTGNLISLAIVFGWAAQGIAWRLAPGLTGVIAVGFVLSAVSRRNIYCSHLCPHGAAQQLLKRKGQSRKLPVWVSKLLWLPGLTLVLAVTVTLFGLNWNLAAWEPFNAYIWYVAGVSSLVLAVSSLLVSRFVPMAYCRYACATGRLLDYVRRSARSDRFTFADVVALTIAVVAWARVFA